MKTYNKSTQYILSVQNFTFLNKDKTSDKVYALSEGKTVVEI